MNKPHYNKAQNRERRHPGEHLDNSSLDCWESKVFKKRAQLIPKKTADGTGSQVLLWDTPFPPFSNEQSEHSNFSLYSVPRDIIKNSVSWQIHADPAIPFRTPYRSRADFAEPWPWVHYQTMEAKLYCIMYVLVLQGWDAKTYYNWCSRLS